MHKEELKEVGWSTSRKRVRITPQRVAMLEFLASVMTRIQRTKESSRLLTKEDPQVSVATCLHN